MLDRALRRSRPGPYQVQAAIAACHAAAPTAADTDWAEIAALYGELARMTGSPVVELNRAVAVAMADGPAAGLALVDALDASGALAGYRYLHPRRGPTCCAGSTAVTRPPPRTAPLVTSPPPTPNAATSTADWRSSIRTDGPLIGQTGWGTGGPRCHPEPMTSRRWATAISVVVAACFTVHPSGAGRGSTAKTSESDPAMPDA